MLTASIIPHVQPVARSDTMLLEIRGHRLPGRSWHNGNDHYDDVHVGIQVGRTPDELVQADAKTATWHIPIDVVVRDGEFDFKGPAVQGRPGARFVYLTWANVDDDGSFKMFRRAKLMLADLEPFVSTDTARVIARIHLTDDCGGPRCARLRSPALEFSR
jgi:Family of unknown function (DUF5990)